MNDESRNFKPHPLGEERRGHIRSFLLEVIRSPIDLKYKDKLLDDLIWKYTEADDKWNVRYCSRAALIKAKGQPLRHEHVHTKKSLKSRLREAQNLDDIEQIMEDAIACIVLKDEHDQLSKFDKTHVGWDRYAVAGIEWVQLEPQEHRSSSKECPECGHEFQGAGWDGIDAHWRSQHSHIRSYEEAWPQIVSGKYVRSI